MNRRKRHNRGIYKKLVYSVLFSGLGLLSCFFIANFSDVFIPQSVVSIMGMCLYFALMFNILGFSVIRISNWFGLRFPQYTKKRLRMLILYGAIAVILLVLNYILFVSLKLLWGSETPFMFPNGGLKILFLAWFIELIILCLLLINQSMNQSLILQQKTAKLQEENDKAQYIALQNQLNPHFLFNSLNVLISEIEYNPKNAIVFTQSLSNIYRYVLKQQHCLWVTLDEEMQFIQSYIYLHQVRLNNCIIIDNQINKNDLEAQLPPLTLQLLIENVLKHNIITPQHPMKIQIMTENESYLIISNRMNLKIGTDSSGTGLKNLSKRCEMLLNKPIIVDTSNKMFTVKVPLLYE